MSRLAAWGALLLLAAGCGGAVRLRDPGGAFAFRPGTPNVDLEVTPTLHDGTGLDVALSVPYASLVFPFMGEDFRTVVETRIRLFSTVDQVLVTRAGIVDTVIVSDEGQRASFDRYEARRRLPVPPGTYLVEVTVHDRGGGRETRRRLRVTVPDPQAPFLGPMRLWAGGRRVLGTGTGSPEGAWQVRMEARALPPGRLLLLRFPRDTTVALPPYALAPLRGSLRYQGIRYDAPDTLLVAPLPAGDDRTADLPPLPGGVYRLEAHAGSFARTRDLVILPPGYPRVTTLRVMAEALAYLIDGDPYRALLDAPSEAERRRRFDAFWGRLIGDRTKAANTVRAYYSRVEEANLRFTSFKEGWKTDRGMVYIILGEPDRIEHRIDAEVWYYDTPGERTGPFVFERVPVFDAEETFVHYVLKREDGFQQAWTRAVQRWQGGAF